MRREKSSTEAINSSMLARSFSSSYASFREAAFITSRTKVFTGVSKEEMTSDFIIEPKAFNLPLAPEFTGRKSQSSTASYSVRPFCEAYSSIASIVREPMPRRGTFIMRVSASES